MTETKFVVRCVDHPTYRAIKKPKAECHTCEVLWQSVHNPEFSVTEADLIIDQMHATNPHLKNKPKDSFGLDD